MTKFNELVMKFIRELTDNLGGASGIVEEDPDNSEKMLIKIYVDKDAVLKLNEQGE